jgi:Type I restriction-modification system methyltransferase subunit
MNKNEQNKEFSDLTLDYIKQDNLKHRKSLGQYFTPRSIIERLLGQLPNDKSGLRILDPACGTGEFLIVAKKYFKNPKLYGWEIDEKLVKISKKNSPEATILNVDSLSLSNNEKFDIIIGNPPYFELSPTSEILKEHSEVMNGRTNIFSLFIHKGIKLLNEGGYLAYVIPPSMNNGAYFSKLREYIISNTNIEYVEVLDGSKLFDKALQTVMLLVLKKATHVNKYVFTKNDISIITENKSKLEKLFKDRTTLYELGYKVKTGKMVWNQNKDILTDRETKDTVPLIWSYNITSDGLQIPIKKDKKPQYVKSNNFDIGPAIVVNRIVGTVNSARIKSALIPKGMKFIGENHTNVIYFPKQESLLSDNKPKITIEEINRQINLPENLEILKSITGNTQISKNELEKLFPINIKTK